MSLLKNPPRFDDNVAQFISDSNIILNDKAYREKHNLFTYAVVILCLLSFAFGNNTITIIASVVFTLSIANHLMFDLVGRYIVIQKMKSLNITQEDIKLAKAPYYQKAKILNTINSKIISFSKRNHAIY